MSGYWRIYLQTEKAVIKLCRCRDWLGSSCLVYSIRAFFRTLKVNYYVSSIFLLRVCNSTNQWRGFVFLHRLWLVFHLRYIALFALPVFKPYHSLDKFSIWYMGYIFSFYFPENRLWHFMQIVSFAGHVKALFLRKIKQIFQTVFCWIFYPIVLSVNIKSIVTQY